MKTEAPAAKAPETLQACQTLGEVCDFIKANYDPAQPFSNGGKTLLAAYLKKATPKK